MPAVVEAPASKPRQLTREEQSQLVEEFRPLLKNVVNQVYGQLRRKGYPPDREEIESSLLEGLARVLRGIDVNRQIAALLKVSLGNWGRRYVKKEVRYRERFPVSLSNLPDTAETFSREPRADLDLLCDELGIDGPARDCLCEVVANGERSLSPEQAREWKRIKPELQRKLGPLYPDWGADGQLG